ncbi:SNARE-interacting protein KEULE-like [Papaver somniferum]|uniref:SNARE-interacting protein KEULE-like n=1 Tax=Papaver somniferum TaxID=3469 RepID=UPI000E6FDD6A|nr:SNARE-interacting protein KEULE-like [Papaver somniferum]
MCHDLLNTDWNEYVHKVKPKSGHKFSFMQRLLKDEQNYQRDRTKRFWEAGAGSCIWRRWAKRCDKFSSDATRENKLGLMMIHSVAYPENFEGEKGLKLMQLAGLSQDDMNAVNNMRLLDDTLATERKSKGDFSLNFGSQKKKHAI